MTSRREFILQGAAAWAAFLSGRAFAAVPGSFDGTDRWTQVSDLRAWLDGAPPEIDRIPRRARLGEILMMGLRTVRGWTRREFEAAAGCGWDDFSAQLNELAERGLVTLAADTVAPTERGLAFWNDVAESLVFAS